MVSVLALAGCGGVDLGGFNLRSPNPTQHTAARPEPDARGVISYPTYQVAVARRGDTVADLANRIGLSASEIASYNGLQADSPLRDGELLALPRQVSANDSVQNITAIATNAIDRAEQPAQAAGTGLPQSPQTGNQPVLEPIRHRVERGETAYSIARLYNVSVTALASWNRLGPDLAVREGQQLLIPIVDNPAPPAADASKPGQVSATPAPPSAAKPWPRKVVATVLPPSPELGKLKTKTKSSKFLTPVEGKIISGYSGRAGGNEGIDIAASPGTAVVAAADGEVALISKSVGAGTIVLLRHANNIYTVYANITDVTLRKGEKVQRGQRLGGVAKGDPSFLHFEVRRGTQSVDPVPFL